VVVTTTNGVNWLAGLQTTMEIRGALEAEWFLNKYDEDSAKILQRNVCL
jgi:hypothetical protein